MPSPTLILLFLALLITTGCANAADNAGATRPSTQPTTLSGTLHGNMAAIGGETSGWVLVGDGATGGMDLDVSAVREQAERLDAQHVTVTGRIVTKRYVERGETPILVVEQIAAAPKQE